MTVNVHKYGIRPQLVEEIKQKMKNPVMKQQVTDMVKPLTKTQLQNPAFVKKLLKRITNVLGVSLSAEEARNIVRFVIDQKIDPNNKLHLIRLWGMFR